jgi:hypothetical protein
MNEQVLDRMSSFFYNELLKNLSNVFIFKDDDNSYLLYDRYYVTKTDKGIEVTLKYGHNNKVFNTLQNAVTWCIYDKRNKIDIANRVEFLDQMISGLNSSISINKKIIDGKNDLDTKYIALAKLSESKYKKKNMMNELLGYVRDSKEWQLKQFSKN